MNKQTMKRLQTYQLTAIFSIVFALVGFSYNVWRLEQSEQNTIVRTACFEILTQLSELEQLVYSAHYDQQLVTASPRKGWVKVGLISDLSVLASKNVVLQANQLKSVWADNWQAFANDKQATDSIVEAIELVRVEVKSTVASLN